MTAYRFFSMKKCSSWKYYLIFKNWLPGSKFVTENAYSSPTRKISIFIRLSVTKMIEFGHVERKPTSSKVVFWLSAKSLQSMSWCLLVCVSVAKDGCIVLKRKLKLIAYIMLASTCFQISSKTAIACCHALYSSSSRTARQHAQHAMHRTGCGPAVQISSLRTSGLQICWI